MAKCRGCGKFLSPAEAAKCCNCSSTYHRECVALPITGSLSPDWHCPECTKNKRRINQPDTPVRGAVQYATSVAECTAMETSILDCSSLDTTHDQSQVLTANVLREELRAWKNDFHLDHTAFRQEFRDFSNKITTTIKACSERIGILESRVEVTYKAINDRLEILETRLAELEKRDITEKPNVQEIDEVVAQLRRELNERDQDLLSKKLHLLSPPAFAVERVISSACGSRLCVWGSRGVTVAELPTRWGRGGLFDSGSQTVLCKSYSLDERFLYSQGEVRRVHWHPSSLSHLLVLVSDNTIRLYNIALKSGPKLVKIITIGAKPSSQLAGKTILDSLGDTAVDFTTVPGSDDLLILRGNGDVYMMQCELDSKSGVQPKLSGPLAMYPPADDNYGSESCSITALGGDTPTLVVVATCSAALYHCLLLPNPSDKEDGDSHALYVVEAVELNIALNADTDLQYSYPVHLYPCMSNTYACVHAGGVHAVSLSMLQQLKHYARADDEETETVLSAICSKPSVAQHLVCTSGLNAAFSPPVGIALTAPPLPGLLVLCTDGILLTRTLEPYDLEEQLYKELQLKNPALEDEDISSILKERQKMSFTAIIQEILARDVSQPILNVNKTAEPSPKECLELVTQATVKLRGEYMSRQQRAADAVTRKLATLRSLTSQHQGWLQDLQADINDAQLQSTVLQEKCALAEKYQDDIKYRCSAVIRNMRGSSTVTAAERELLAELCRYKSVGEALQQRIQVLQQHATRKSKKLKQWQEDYKKKDIALGKSHSDTISSILQQQTSQISTLIEETKLLKDQLSIV